MNTDQLGEIVRATLDALENSGTLKSLNEFNVAFNNLTEQSTDPHQLQFNDKRKELQAALQSEEFRQFPNTWRTALEELGLFDLIGDQLQQTIDDLIENNQLTPVIARDEIRRLTADLANYRTEFTKIREAFDYLKFGETKTDPGEGVLSVLMPRNHYESDLALFAEEIKALSVMAGLLSELVTGRTDSPKVKELSTTEPWILLSMLLGTVLAFLQIVEKMQNIRINSYNMKRLKAQAQEYGAGPGVEGAIQTEVDKIVKKQLAEILEWLFNTYTKAPKGRINEIRTPMEKKLAWLADCLDHGYQIDGDAGELDAESDLPEGEKQQYSVAAGQIKEISVRIKYLETPNEPVLALAKPERDKKSKASSTRPKSDKSGAESKS